MEPYELIKNKNAPAILKEAPQMKPEGDCLPCRKKIAQETFEMTVRGSSYLPTLEPIAGSISLEDALAGKIRYSSPVISKEAPKQRKDTGCSSCGNKTAQEKLNITKTAGSYIPRIEPVSPFKYVNEVMQGDNYTTFQPKDEISRLYGLEPQVFQPKDEINRWYDDKLPTIQPFGGVPIKDDSTYPDTMDKPPDSGPLFPYVPIEFPCKRNIDGSYNYPTSYYSYHLYELYLPNTKHWFRQGRINYLLLYNGKEFKLNIDLNDYFNELIKCLWCSNDRSKLNACWETFGQNCKDAINNYVKDKYKADPDDVEIVLRLIENMVLRLLLEDIKKDAEYFIYELSSEIRNSLTENINSCICGGTEPTRCCFLYDELGKIPECWCGEQPKNLCEDCKDKYILNSLISSSCSILNNLHIN